MAIGFRTPIRKSPTKIEGSARLPRMLCSAAAEQKQAQKSARHPGKSLCLFYLFEQECIHCAGAGWIATARTGGVSRGAPFWLWVSNRDEQHPCWVSGYVSNCNHIYTSIMPPFWRICLLISSSQIQPRKSYASTLKFVIISVAL